MSLLNKRWASFEEMYADLKKDHDFGALIRADARNELQTILKKIEVAKSSKDFFDSICRISSIFEKLDNQASKRLFKDSNIYVLVLNATLSNDSFINAIHELIKRNQSISFLRKEEVDLRRIVLINSALSLAFFGIALEHGEIDKCSIEYLRKNVSDLLKKICRKGDERLDFVSTCYFLERIAWDNGFHLNNNSDAKFPIKLDSKFLFSNLKTSRSVAGITLLSLVIRPAIEDRFRKIITHINGNSFEFSKELNLLYEIANELGEKFEHYHRNATKNLREFFNVFIKRNEHNLIFCLKNVCAGFNFQPLKTFPEVMLAKISLASDIKNELTDYTLKNFRAFNNAIHEGDGEWTNKLFLISIKTFSALEAANKATDKKWTFNVGLYEFHQWILEMHEVLNKFYIEDDWDKIKDCISSENTEIEWKSSFFTPLEQELEDQDKDVFLKDRVFEAILKVVLAMLNTNGGTLIVGLIENPQNIKRQGIQNFILQKNGVFFFDIGHEFNSLGKTLDSVRLQILDRLKQLTDSTQDKFNNLIEFEPIVLRSDDKAISIIRINITKAPKPFFKVKKENNTIWIALTKRAQGQNIDVDTREYFLN